MSAKGRFPSREVNLLIKEITEAIGFPRWRALQISRRSLLEAVGVGATALPGWSPRSLRGR